MRVLKEMEDKFKKGIDERVQEKVNVFIESMGSGVVPQEPVPNSFSPQFRGHNSCGSTPLDDEEANAPHMMDNITDPVNVRLYSRQQWTTDKVVVGRAFPVGDGTNNGRPIPLGYAHVSIDNLLDKKYNKMHIDYLT
jgi:hypothetical protein